ALRVDFFAPALRVPAFLVAFRFVLLPLLAVAMGLLSFRGGPTPVIASSTPDGDRRSHPRTSCAVPIRAVNKTACDRAARSAPARLSDGGSIGVTTPVDNLSNVR